MSVTNKSKQGAFQQSPNVFSPEYLCTVSNLLAKSDRKENLRDVQKAVLILVLVVDAAHQSRRGWEHLIDEDEDGLLWRQLDALANNIYELADSEICRN
jgi:hypothetical protein